jgi:hypothetical protein
VIYSKLHLFVRLGDGRRQMSETLGLKVELLRQNHLRLPLTPLASTTPFCRSPSDDELDIAEEDKSEVAATVVGDENLEMDLRT